MTDQDQYKQGDLVRYKGETYLVGKQPLGYEGYAAHLVGLTDDGNYIKFDALQLVAKAEDIATIATLTAERDALVEAVKAMEDQSTTVDEDGEDRCTQCGWYAYAHEPACVFALAAQIKEQDGE